MIAVADAVLAEAALATPGYLAILVALFLQHRPVRVIFLLAFDFLYSSPLFAPPVTLMAVADAVLADSVPIPEGMQTQEHLQRFQSLAAKKLSSVIFSLLVSLENKR